MTDFAHFFTISKMQWMPEHLYKSDIKVGSLISLWEQCLFYSIDTKFQKCTSYCYVMYKL